MPFTGSDNLQNMREVMRQRLDFLFAEGIGDIGHRRHGAAGPHARLVVVQRLQQIVLALAGDARHRLGAGIAVGVARRAAPARGGLRALARQIRIVVLLCALGGVSEAK